MRNKVYIASLFSRREEMEEIADELRDVGYDVVSRWVYGGEDGLTREDIALLDLEDVDEADIVISFTEPYKSFNPGGGRHVEFGYAYALAKRCIIIGERENVFHHLPGIEVYDTIEDFIQKEYEDYV